MNVSGPLYLICVLVLWAMGLYALYWVIRLAVRHALSEVGLDRGAFGSPEDDPPRRPSPVTAPPTERGPGLTRHPGPSIRPDAGEVISNHRLMPLIDLRWRACGGAAGGPAQPRVGQAGPARAEAVATPATAATPAGTTSTVTTTSKPSSRHATSRAPLAATIAPARAHAAETPSSAVTAPARAPRSAAA